LCTMRRLCSPTLSHPGFHDGFTGGLLPEVRIPPSAIERSETVTEAGWDSGCKHLVCFFRIEASFLETFFRVRRQSLAASLLLSAECTLVVGRFYIPKLRTIR